MRRFLVALSCALTLIVPFAGPAHATSTIAVGVHPYGVTESGGAVYVANMGSDSVSQIDPATNAVTRTYALPAGAEPYAVGVTPTELLVVSPGLDEVEFIDRSSGTLISQVAVGGFPYGIAIDGDTAYVTSNDTGDVYVIDIPNRTVRSTIDFGSGYRHSVVIVGSTGFVTDITGTRVWYFDTQTNTVLGSIADVRYPVGLATDGTFVYAAAYFEDWVFVIDASTRTVVNEVELPGAVSPLGMAVANGRVIVADNGGTAMWSFPVGGGTAFRVPVGTSTAFVAVTNDTVYASNENDGTVTVLPLSAFMPMANAGDGPPDVLQQVEVAEAGDCAAYRSPGSMNWSGVGAGGWSQSWSTWARSGAGASVCTRTLGYTAGSWVLR